MILPVLFLLQLVANCRETVLKTARFEPNTYPYTNERCTSRIVIKMLIGKLRCYIWMWLSALCFGQCVCCLDEVGARLHHAPCQSPQCAGRLYERGSRSRLFWAVTDHQCLSLFKERQCLERKVIYCKCTKATS